MLEGYGGRVLYIDLTEKDFKIESTDPSWMKEVIGGRAANTKRLAEELDVDCDPLGPENLLIFGIGPLTGSYLTASAYYTITAKSPLTGILGDSAAGGQFAYKMKQTGFDQIIIRGRGERLSYIAVEEDGARIVECERLRGKNIVEATASIRKEQGDFSAEVAAIGPAGENLVLFACVVSSGNRVNGRCGMGAVMGSKNLKALAVNGSRHTELKDPLGFFFEVKKIEEKIMNHPEYRKRHDMGTTMLMSDLNGMGILPTRHFQEGICPYIDGISGQRLASSYKVKNKSCFNCNVHCSRYYVCGDVEAEGPEFETLCSFTSRIGNDDLAFALKMNHFLNQNGLDSISTGEVLGWLMECQQKGLIEPNEIGFKIEWGEKEKIFELVEKITKREGIGERLADGARKFSERFGLESRKLVMHVKGLDVICGDPRGIKAYGLTYATASRGGDHLRAEPYFELTDRKEEAKKRFGTEKAADRLSEEGKAALVTYSEKIALLCDSLTMCKNVGLCMDVLDFDNCSALLSSATGIRYTPEYLKKIMGDSVNLQHELNNKFGVTREEDTLPERFQKESLKEGPTEGSTVDIKRMVDEYYKLHGWD